MNKRMIKVCVLEDHEKLYAYKNCSQISGQTGCIGYLCGDFEANGKDFQSTWNELPYQQTTDEFTKELNHIIELLRSPEYKLLQSRNDMISYVKSCKKSKFMEKNCIEYGFRINTANYSYLLRCNPDTEGCDFCCFCYKKEYLDLHISRALKGIRFIDSSYKELFRITDGSKIRIISLNGTTNEKICRYIDDYHTEIGGCIYHICEFAERMEACGSIYQPVEM